MRRRKALQREKPMKRRGRGPRQPKPKAARRRPLRVSPEQWGPLRQAVYDRAGGRCERCHTRLSRLPWWECHHRKLKSRGGADAIENLLALCPDCHNGHPESAHRQPKFAELHGWIVASWGDPARWPVTLWDGRQVLLDTDGGYIELPGVTAGEAAA